MVEQRIAFDKVCIQMIDYTQSQSKHEDGGAPVSQQLLKQVKKDCSCSPDCYQPPAVLSSGHICLHSGWEYHRVSLTPSVQRIESDRALQRKIRFCRWSVDALVLLWIPAQGNTYSQGSKLTGIILSKLLKLQVVMCSHSARGFTSVVGSQHLL